jgi:bacterioferritin
MGLDIEPRRHETMSKDIRAKREEIARELVAAYQAELETVINYLANSVHLDGVRAAEIKKSLAAEVQEELTHAGLLAKRIKTLGASIPGSMKLEMSQKSLQPPANATDVIGVIKGVIEAEESAIAQYNKIVAMCDGVDYVTQDLAVQLLGDEEEHCRLYMGYLREYEKA